LEGTEKKHKMGGPREEELLGRRGEKGKNVFSFVAPGGERRSFPQRTKRKVGFPLLSRGEGGQGGWVKRESGLSPFHRGMGKGKGTEGGEEKRGVFPGEGVGTGMKREGGGGSSIPSWGKSEKERGGKKKEEAIFPFHQGGGETQRFSSHGKKLKTGHRKGKERGEFPPREGTRVGSPFFLFRKSKILGWEKSGGGYPAFLERGGSVGGRRKNTFV